MPHGYHVASRTLRVSDYLVEIVEIQHRTAISDLVRDRLRPRDLGTEALQAARRVLRRGRMRRMLPAFLQRHLVGIHLQDHWADRLMERLDRRIHGRADRRHRIRRLLRAIARRMGARRERRLSTLFETVRREVRAGHIVCVPHRSVRRYGAKVDWGLVSVVETVGECAGVVAAAGDRSFLLIGPKAAVRYVCSYMDPPPAADEICESMPARTDFRDLARLWRDFDPFGFDGEDEPFRWLNVIGMGRALARLHLSNVLHGDAHEGNLLGDVVASTAIDFATRTILYQEPSPAQCATDMLPLMRSFSPADWYNFRRGYLYERPQGQAAFDLIEMNDRTGWLEALRIPDYARALDLLTEALLLVEDDDVDQRVMLADKRAQCLSELGRDQEAIESETETVGFAERRLPTEIPRLVFNLAVLHDRAGEQEAALAAVRRVIAWPQEVLPAMSTAPPEDLPQILESANRLLVQLATPGNEGQDSSRAPRGPRPGQPGGVAGCGRDG